MIREMGADALDPIEPPPQGDVTLRAVREEYGEDLVLFGNMEAADIEYKPCDEFSALVANTLREGTAGPGKGFVLLPSASPYGRNLDRRTLQNYETMVRAVEEWQG